MVAPLLVDTNVLSEFRRPAPNPRVVTFMASQPTDSLFVSVVSIAELRFGINLLGMTPQRTDLQTWLDGTMRPAFAGRVLEMSEDVILHGAS